MKSVNSFVLNFNLKFEMLRPGIAVSDNQECGGRQLQVVFFGEIFRRSETRKNNKNV
jgi:hypothetical protein